MRDTNTGSLGLRGKLKMMVGANRELEELRDQLKEKDRKLAELRRRLRVGGAGGIKAENVLWVFGTGRTGSTWFASMMKELPGFALWNEPLVGALYGEFCEARAHRRRGAPFVMGEPHKKVWLRSVRAMVLEGAAARYPNYDSTLIIKEPHGSVGAPILSEALPESRMVVLVRDLRDVIASTFDAQKAGSWAAELGKRRGNPVTFVGKDPDAFVRVRAKQCTQDVMRAKEAYDAHEGPKTLVRYEDLRADTLGTMKRVYSELGISVDEEDLLRAVEKHSWEAIPEEKKGEGKFYRKATPGSWKEDLEPRHAQMVERITAPVLDEFYPGWRGEKNGGS